MSVTIVSICSEAYGGLAEWTVDRNKRLYCQRWGYELVDVRVGVTSDRVAGYERMEIILGLMHGKSYGWKGPAAEDEWYWAMGVDTMITNFNRRLEEFVDPAFHFVIARDFNGLNADSYLVRNSPQGRCWLEFILSQRRAYEGTGFVEQGVMIDWHQREPFRGWIKVTAQSGPEGINAYEMRLYGGTEESEGQWRPGDFLVHWPGRGLEERLGLAAKYAELVMGR